MKQFDITYFAGPPAEYIVQEEIIEDMARAGITLCQIRSIGDVETIKTALKLMKKHGLKAIVAENRILELVEKAQMENVDQVVKEVVEDYKEVSETIEGWEIFDEPDAGQYPILSLIVAAFKKHAPCQETVINLYPNYAPVEALKTKSYVEYVERFIKEVHPDFLSYDHYTFVGRNLNKEVTNNDKETEKEQLIRVAAMREAKRGEFFENIEDIRRLGLDNHIEQMLIILLTEHGDYRNLTKAEILWQVNMCLAYGMQRISYFTYWLPEPSDFWKWDNAMCNGKGEKYQHYYDVQSVNQEIHSIGTILFSHKSEAVFHIGTGENAVRQFEGYGPITSISGEHGVIGFFEDGYIYLVNHDFIYERTFTITANQELARYENDEFISCGNKFTITLSAGAGALLKLQ